MDTTDTRAPGAGSGKAVMTNDNAILASLNAIAGRLDALEGRAPKAQAAKAAKAAPVVKTPPPDGVSVGAIRAAFGGPAQYGPGCKTCGRQTAWDKRRGDWRGRCPGRMLATDPAVAGIRKAGHVTGTVEGDDGNAYVTLAACERSARQTAEEREAAKVADRAHKADGAEAVATMLDSITLPTGSTSVRVRAASKLGRVMLDGDYGTRDGIDAVVRTTKAGAAAFEKAVSAFPWADYGWKTPAITR